jgi:hypothetical protein
MSIILILLDNQILVNPNETLSTAGRVVSSTTRLRDQFTPGPAGLHACDVGIWLEQVTKSSPRTHTADYFNFKSVVC